MKTGLLILLLLGLSRYSLAQLTEDFSDGNYSVNPAWGGTTADFSVNSSGELQITNNVAATSWITVPHGLSSLDHQEWRIWVKQVFSPSAANFGRIYLTAAGSDLSANPDGFFLQLGEAGSQDAIRLKKSSGGIVTEVCAGLAGEIATSFTIGIRVVRDASGTWSLFADPAGGTDYAFEASGMDTTQLIGTHFGMLGTYTVSNATKFHFDNIYVGPEIVDSVPPELVSASAISATTVDVLFDETVAGPDITNPGNYLFNPLQTVSVATQDSVNPALIHLTLGTALQNGQTYNLHVTSATDLTGNNASGLNASFAYLVGEAPEPGDVIVTEFMCDPTPSLGLPEVEFVEVYNRSNKIFDLSGWKLGDASSLGTVLSGWIYPGQYKILCAVASLTDYTTGIGVTSFPSLNNAGDAIVLKTSDSLLVDSLYYSDEWYNDEVKKEGGYTLELINPEDPCSDGTNWSGSVSITGGTPGAPNSVLDTTPDTIVPGIKSALAIAPNQLEITFTEGMDGNSVQTSVWNSNPALTYDAINYAGLNPQQISVVLNENLVVNQLYEFTLGPVSDCWMNSSTIQGQFVLVDQPVPGDIVVNEILFDPATGGSDFVELYNRSQKTFDLHNFGLASIENDTIGNQKTFTGHYLLFPNEYVVCTADSTFQKNQFAQAATGKFIQMQLPFYNNDSSTVIVLYANQVMDKVAYSADWHLSLLNDTENKTLERIDPAGPSTFSGNWHTAAETIGFGTPGKRNSQFQEGTVSGSFGTVNPSFSPDNDGFEDVIQFYYAMPAPEMIATVTIFDDQGRVIRKLLKSELLGTSGSFTWDGITDDEQKAGVGVYIAVIEAFATDGAHSFAKRVSFTLAAKLN